MNHTSIEQKTHIQIGQELLKDFYHCKAEYIRYLGGGSYGHVFLFRVDTLPYQVVMKACLLKGMAEQEVKALDALRSQSLIPIVEVYHMFYQTIGLPYDYILMQYIPGKSAVFSLPLLLGSKQKKRAFAEQFIDNLAAYHQKKHTMFGELTNPVYHSWTDYYFPFEERILDEAEKAYQQHRLEKRIRNLLVDAHKYRATIFDAPVIEASLIHGDYNISNVLVDRKGKILSIIDPLHTMWADAEYDLFQLRNLFGDSFHLYETYKARHKTSKRVDLKCAYYALFHEIYVMFQTGKRFNFILRPLVCRLEKELKKLKKELDYEKKTLENSVK